MSLVSDLRVAHPGVRLGQPEINAGIPSVMGSYWMSLHLGWSMNQELSMTGRLMDADEAQHLGLLNRVVAPEEVITTACDLASQLAGKLRRRLEQRAMLGRSLDLALPAIDGGARPEQVDASGDPFLDHAPPDRLRLLRRGCRGDGRGRGRSGGGGTIRARISISRPRGCGNCWPGRSVPRSCTGGRR